jgi:Fe-S cluster assembly protein SufD
MELKEKLLSSFLAFEGQVDVNSSLHELRVDAMKCFETKGFPTKKDEAWK